MRKHPMLHDARRDTMWVGKGVGSVWLVLTGIAAAASAATWFFR
jgi:hypothetical protein